MADWDVGLPPAAGKGFFGMLDPDDRSFLFSCGNERFYGPEHPIMHQGAPAVTVVVLVHGWAKASVNSVPLHVYGPGDIAGAEAAWPGRNRPESVRAVPHCVALTVPGPRFADALTARPELARAFTLAMLQRAEAADRLLQLQGRSDGERLLRLLLDLGDRIGVARERGIALPGVSQDDLAGMAGVSRSTVTRELRRLRDQDLIRTSYRVLTITDPGKLREIAEMRGSGQYLWGIHG